MITSLSLSYVFAVRERIFSSRTRSQTPRCILIASHVGTMYCTCIAYAECNFGFAEVVECLIGAAHLAKQVSSSSRIVSRLAKNFRTVHLFVLVLRTDCGFLIGFYSSVDIFFAYKAPFVDRYSKKANHERCILAHERAVWFLRLGCLIFSNNFSGNRYQRLTLTNDDFPFSNLLSFGFRLRHFFNIRY